MVKNTIFAVACAALVAVGASPTSAATLFQSTGSPIDAINSIALVNQFHTAPKAIGDTQATVYAITFSLHAYNDDIRIPLQGGFDEKIATSGTPRIRYHVASRYTGTAHAKGVLGAGAIIPEGPITKDGSQMIIKHGTTGQLTVLVAFSNRPLVDEEDRLEISSIPLYFGTSTKPVILNAHEVSELKTDYTTFVKKS